MAVPIDIAVNKGFGLTDDRTITDQFYVEIIGKTVIMDGIGPMPNEKIFFASIPEAFAYSKSATYNDQVIPGRSEHVQVYNSSDNVRVQFTGKLIAAGNPTTSMTDAIAGSALTQVARFYSPAAPYLGITGNAFSLLNNPNGANAGRESIEVFIHKEVHQAVNKLEALLYPQYDNQGVAYTPPKVRLVFGSNFRRIGVLTSFTCNFYGPYMVEDLLAYNADCQMSFLGINDTPKSYIDVYSGKQNESVDVVRNSSPTIWQKLGRDAVSIARSKFGV